jgi:hypothetical protein
VVQQSGADGIDGERSDEKSDLSPIAHKTPLRSMIAREAEVDLPGWGSNLIGDDDSDVTFSPTGKFETFGLQRDLAALKFYSPEWVQRFEQAIESGEVDYSSMEERGGYGGTLQIKAGSKGTIRISVKAHFFIDEKSNDTYDQFFACSWEVEADLKGKLKLIGGPFPEITPIDDAEAPFQLSGLNPTENPDAGSFQISPQFTSFQSTDVPNVNLGGQVGSDKASISGGVTLGNERTYPPGTLVRAFSLKLEVVDIPPPEGKVTIGPISILRGHTVLFPPPKKGKGQDAVSSAEQDKLIAWYEGLNEQTRLKIQQGTIPISLTGYASTTGDTAYNLKLSNSRKENVKEILSVYTGNRAVFEHRAAGEYKAETPDKEESQEERKVVVEVWEQRTEGEEPIGNTTP